MLFRDYAPCDARLKRPIATRLCSEDCADNDKLLRAA
jgi:hypothetical protein